MSQVTTTINKLPALPQDRATEEAPEIVYI